MSKNLHLAALAIGLALVLTFQVVAIHGHSLVGDEAHHLLAGHQALRYGQNTINLEHPPLVKLLVSLPLLLEDEPLTGPVEVDEALARSVRIYGEPELLWRATVRGRYLALALFVVPFFVACFFLGRRLDSSTTGLVLVLLLGLSLSVLPYLTILQTDTAVSLAFLTTVLAGMRFMERPSFGAAAVLGIASGFALAVKYSSILLGPTVLLTFLLAPDLRRSWPRRLAQLTLAGVVVVVVVGLTYRVANRSYDSDVGRRAITTYCDGKGTLVVEGLLKPWEERLLALEQVAPCFTQWLTGLLGIRVQNAIGVYPSYAFGEVKSEGRWWYFPAVLLIKTPLAVLIAAAAAVVLAARRRWDKKTGDASGKPGRPWLLPAVTVAVYLATSITSSYNLSVRHMLPVLAFLYLPLAAWLARRLRAAVLVATVLALESLILSPLWMSSTNTWWLGSRNPTRFALGAGNCEWRQNFIQLGRWAEDHDIEALNVLYPAIGPEIIHAYLPDARLVGPGQDLEPGWYAVSVIVEQFVPALLAAPPGAVWDGESLRRAAEQWRPFWQAVVDRGEDRGWVAGTFHVYRIDAPPP